MTTFIGSIITDCGAPIDEGRQKLAFQRLFDGASPAFVGVAPTSSAPTLEVAAHLVDQLDVLDSFHASPEQQAVVLAQAAPRGSDIKMNHDNGTPFCYFWHNKTLVAGTLNGCLSLARDHGLVDEVEVVDIPTLVAAMTKSGDLSDEEAKKIINTQFRSLWLLPRLARWVVDGKNVPSTTQKLDHNVLPPTGHVVCIVDGFSNVKTTIRPEEIGFKEGLEVELASGATAICHTRLADVATGETALIIGSSGYGAVRRLEVVVGRGRAAETYDLAVGSAVLKG